MNKRQLLVLGLTLLIIGLVFWFTPRYKLVKIDENNYIRTSQHSSLYKSCKSPEQFEWPTILKISLPIAVLGSLLVFLLKEKS
jgi:hypothetical protein